MFSTKKVCIDQKQFLFPNNLGYKIFIVMIIVSKKIFKNEI